jgi:hypothetical protein
MIDIITIVAIIKRFPTILDLTKKLTLFRIDRGNIITKAPTRYIRLSKRSASVVPNALFRNSRKKMTYDMHEPI